MAFNYGGQGYGQGYQQQGAPGYGQYTQAGPQPYGQPQYSQPQVLQNQPYPYAQPPVHGQQPYYTAPPQGGYYNTAAHGGHGGVPAAGPSNYPSSHGSGQHVVYHQGTPQSVPNQPLRFSSHTGTYSYQYSQCTGRKKALLIGINYFGQAKGQLRGCINDVKNMSQFLIERFGYKREDMVILTDDQQNPKSLPTKQNIIQAMHWLVKDAQPNDSLFFHYSGHGGQKKDLDGDESDGYDETIFPMDFRFNGYIVDDDMHAIMVAPLQAGVRLTAIFDSCHSGSALDLPYLYSTQGTLKEPNLLRDAGEGLIDVLGHYQRGDVSSVVTSGVSLFKKVTTGKQAEAKSRRTKTSPADVIQWSGSKDTQKSADTTEGGEATGAMSHAFIAALKRNPNQSYQQLLQNIRKELAGRYQQKPQLSCSHPLDTKVLYVM